MSDWQLVSAYAGGDEEAFASLVRKYFSTVHSAAVRQVSDPHLAEDTLSDVTLAIVGSWQRFDQLHPFDKWARGF